MSFANVCAATRTVASTLSIGTDILVDSIDIIENPKKEGWKILSIASRTAILAFNIVDAIGTISGGYSTKTTEKIKPTEMFIRIFDGALQGTKIVVDGVTKEKFTAAMVRSLIQKSFLLPIASISRNALEMAVNDEKMWLDKATQDPRAIRPIYEDQPNLFEYLDQPPILVGFKPIDKEECKRNIVEFEKRINVTNVIETGLEIASTEYAIKKIITRCLVEETCKDTKSPQRVLDLDKKLGFKNFKEIPPEFYNDETLKQYVCPLTKKPIRNLVAEKNGSKDIYFEKDAITAWLIKNKTSPVTGKPLQAEDLKPCFTKQLIINGRLEFLSATAKKHLSDSLSKVSK